LSAWLARAPILLIACPPSCISLPSWPRSSAKPPALHAEELDLFRLQQADVRKRLANHDPTAIDTFTANFLNADPASYNLSDDEAAYVISTLFEAGAGTTAAALMLFLLAMTLHPDVFAKLQAELDAVVGPNRFSTFADTEALPRVRATCQTDPALASCDSRWCATSAR
jgi:cytochrome P450